MASKSKLIELIKDDLKFRAIGEPKIMRYSTPEERRREIINLSLYGAQAYRLGEKARFAGETSTIWLQAVQYYIKARNA